MFGRYRLPSLVAAALILVGCAAVMTGRPTQEMSDTAAAIRAAREVQADTLAPDLFRLATEWFQKARREYKFKNFKEAKEYTELARRYAEQAEFEAIKGGATRNDVVAEPAANPGGMTPPEYATPTGTPVESYTETPKVTPPAPELPKNPIPTPSRF